MLLNIIRSVDDDSSDQTDFPSALLNNAQMIAAEHAAMDDGVSGYDLMTSAGQAVANVVHNHYPSFKVLILCGPGNNGGDGFVAARFLKEMGVSVDVMALISKGRYKNDASMAVQDWVKGQDGKVLGFKKLPEYDEHDKVVVIDAVFGTGLSRSLGSKVYKIFDQIREHKWPVVAVDIPSGVNGNTGEIDEYVLHAEKTVTFFRKKLGHVLMPSMPVCGEVLIHDIGIDPGVLTCVLNSEVDSEVDGEVDGESADQIHGETKQVHVFSALENEQELWIEKFPHKTSGDHKYKNGHVVVLGGTQMTGAARMSAQAAMKMGAGLCTIVTAHDSASIYKVEQPHIMVEQYDSLSAFSKHIEDERRNVVVIGPGAGLADKDGLCDMILDVLSRNKITVLDADGLSCFEGRSAEMHSALHAKCILTPHDGEFARIFPGLEGTKIDKVVQAVQLSGANILYKGADTVIGAASAVNVKNAPAASIAGGSNASGSNASHSIASGSNEGSNVAGSYSGIYDGSKVVVNTHASPWLATAGSGDVLAGIIASLCAQGMGVFKSACAGVWIHGESALKYGPGLTSPDIIEGIPRILRKIT